MKVTFDREVDVLRVMFSDRPIAESDEVSPGLIVDYAEDGAVVGVELLGASTTVPQPQLVELYAA